MNDKVTGIILLGIILAVGACAIFLPKTKLNTVKTISNQTETNKLNYDALSSMVNVQNARLVKKNIVIQEQISQLIELNEEFTKQNSKLLKEVVRLQELVINHEEKIYNLEEKNKDYQNRFDQAGQFFKDIADFLAGINRDIMALEARDDVFQAKFEEICNFLSYVEEKIKDQPKVDIRCYKFHRPGCN